MKHLQNLLSGFSLMHNVLASPPPYPDLRGGFTKDRAALRRDTQTIVREFNYQIGKAYGEQEYPR